MLTFSVCPLIRTYCTQLTKTRSSSDQLSQISEFSQRHERLSVVTQEDACFPMRQVLKYCLVQLRPTLNKFKVLFRSFWKSIHELLIVFMSSILYYIVSILNYFLKLCNKDKRLIFIIFSLTAKIFILKFIFESHSTLIAEQNQTHCQEIHQCFPRSPATILKLLPH